MWRCGSDGLRTVSQQHRNNNTTTPQHLARLLRESILQHLLWSTPSFKPWCSGEVQEPHGSWHCEIYKRPSQVQSRPRLCPAPGHSLVPAPDLVPSAAASLASAGRAGARHGDLGAGGQCEVHSLPHRGHSILQWRLVIVTPVCRRAAARERTYWASSGHSLVSHQSHIAAIGRAQNIKCWNADICRECQQPGGC